MPSRTTASTGGHNHHADRSRSDSVENYAKAIFALQQQGDGAVGTTQLAERLGVNAGSVSGMLRKLADLGLVEHAPYHGVSLTAEGERVALHVIRQHRLLELFLSEILEVPWDRVHAEAEILEHHISDELCELIARKLGDPTHDPHGDPIPTRDLVMPAQDSVPLDELAIGSRARFVRISDSQPEMLRHLTERGILPGATLEIAGRDPFGGPVRVRSGDHEHALGPELARMMRVEVTA